MFSKNQVMFCVLWILSGILLDLVALTVETLRMLSIAHLVSFAMTWYVMGSKNK